MRIAIGSIMIPYLCNALSRLGELVGHLFQFLFERGDVSPVSAERLLHLSQSHARPRVHAHRRLTVVRLDDPLVTLLLLKIRILDSLRYDIEMI